MCLTRNFLSAAPNNAFAFTPHALTRIRRPLLARAYYRGITKLLRCCAGATQQFCATVAARLVARSATRYCERSTFFAAGEKNRGSYFGRRRKKRNGVFFLPQAFCFGGGILFQIAVQPGSQKISKCISRRMSTPFFRYRS